jgi:acyl-CoA reductase-like NAD-dependent aldehyde dehydrogenase
MWNFAGVFNIVNGGGPEVAAPLLDEDGIKCLAFTGSTQVGALLGCQAVSKMKRLQLELGGKNPLIVLNDVGMEGASLNLEKAAEQVRGFQRVAYTREFARASRNSLCTAHGIK